MKRTDDARKEILRAIRENLAQGQSSPPVLLSTDVERGNEGPPFLPFFSLSKRRGVVILSERAARARAKDLLFSDAATQVVRLTGGEDRRETGITA